VTILHDPDQAPVEFILHPTDLSAASERAFYHALAIAVRLGSRFSLLHSARRPADEGDLPGVRATLAKWKAAGYRDELGPGRKRPRIEKLMMPGKDPVAAVKGYVARHPVDMLVTATEGRTGLARLLKPSTAQRMARETKLPTLFVPAAGRTFVDGDTGRVTLRRILLPMDPETDASPAMLRAVRSAALLEDPSLEITLLHITDGSEPRAIEAPQLPYCRWFAVERPGKIVDGILAAAEEFQSDAIYMATTWSKGGFGREEGDVTEQVVTEAPCPVMAVPTAVTA
jgi:nucleotide-binding universal stress UspA family protein